MLRTPLCRLLGIDHPIIQAGMGPFGSGAELAAAVSNAGAIGSLGATVRPVDDLRQQLAMLADLTDLPFIINFTQPWLQQNPETFDIALEYKPPVVSLALGDPAGLPERAHDAGALFVQQVHTREQAELVAERGVDVIIAQGTEAGGFTGTVAMTLLVLEVIDAVSPIPVVAAGGIADGRGIAAALVLGADGVNLGTRFLASEEASVSQDWKKAILAAQSQDAVKVDVWDRIFPKPAGGAFNVVPRALGSVFIEEWERRGDEAGSEAERLQAEMMLAIQEERFEEVVPFTGQTAGLISEVLPAGEIVHQLVLEAEDTLRRVSRLQD
jgi:nitronate monooxygenase/enoyl-[acyl-carrier protein] reductase II